MDLCEFLAEDELVEINPTFKYTQQLHLISGDFGPFHPSVPIKVPIWLALNLSRQHKCSILPPNWITTLCQQDELNESDLSAMPSEFWREIIKLLEENYEGSVNCSHLIERRESILRKSTHELFRHAERQITNFLTSDVTLHNVSRAELQKVKEILQKCFNHLQQLRLVQFSM